MQTAAATAGSPFVHGYPETVLSAPEAQNSVLSNGICVVSDGCFTETDIVSLCFAVDAGSRSEPGRLNGISSVLAKVAFTGLEKQISALGGAFNATASRESIVFRATVHKSQVTEALNVLAGATKLLAGDEALQVAKKAIFDEINTGENAPEAHVMEHLHDAAYLNSPMGMPVLGTAKTVANISASDVDSFVSHHLIGPRLVLTASGGVQHNDLVDIASSLLGDISSSPSGGVDEAMKASSFVGSDKRLRYDSKPLVSLAFAFEGPSATSQHVIPVQVIQAVLGSWDRRSNVGCDGASRFSIEMAERGLAHRASAFTTHYKDSGLIGITAVCPDNKLDDFMWYSLDNLVRICHTVTDEEVQRAIVALKTAKMLNAADPAAAALDLAHQQLAHGRCVPAAEMLARIDAVTTQNVKDTGMQFIHDHNHALAAVGPIYELPDYNWIRYVVCNFVFLHFAPFLQPDRGLHQFCSALIYVYVVLFQAEKLLVEILDYRLGLYNIEIQGQNTHVNSVRN